MSTRAVIIPMHRYQPHQGTGYRVLFEYFLKNLSIWAEEVDKLYIIDSDMNFSEEDLTSLKQIKPNTVICKTEGGGSHWGNLEWIIPQVTEESMLIMDHDVIVNKKGVVDGWFKATDEGYDFVGSFDSSGGLRDQIHNKYSFMKKHDVTRMGSYYFILTKKLLEKIEKIDFAPLTNQEGLYIPELDYTLTKDDWMDSFGMFTIKMLSTNPKIKIIEDPRDSIYLQEGKIVRDIENPKNLGYYHIRNANLANYIISSRGEWVKQYEEGLTNNPRELLRLLAWFEIMSENKFDDKVTPVLLDMKIDLGVWTNYLDEFVEYHNL